MSNGGSNDDDVSNRGKSRRGSKSSNASDSSAASFSVSGKRRRDSASSNTSDESDVSFSVGGERRRDSASSNASEESDDDRVSFNVHGKNSSSSKSDYLPLRNSKKRPSATSSNNDDDADIDIDIESNYDYDEDADVGDVDIEIESNPDDPLLELEELEKLEEEEKTLAKLDKKRSHTNENTNDPDVAGKISFPKLKDNRLEGKIEFPAAKEDLEGKIEFTPLSNSPLLDNMLSDVDPNLIRVITSIRIKKEKIGGIHVHVAGTSNLRNAIEQGSTMDLFVPCLVALMQELNALSSNHKSNPITPEQLQQGQQLMEQWRGLGKTAALAKIHPELPNFLEKIRNLQFLSKESSLFNLYAAQSEAGIAQRLPTFGLRSRSRAQFIAIFRYAREFNGTSVIKNGNDSFCMMQVTKDGKQVKLLEGKSENESLVLTIPPDIPNENRYDAIAKLMFVVATHTQQNNSNVFKPTFGDDAIENAVMIYLAFYKYRLHIQLPTGYQNLLGEIAASDKLSAEQKNTLINGLNFAFDHAKMFSTEIERNGNKRIDKFPPLPGKIISKMNNNDVNNAFKNQLAGLHTVLAATKIDPDQVNHGQMPNATVPSKQISSGPDPKKPRHS